jgi:hypothetical protein
MLRMRSEVLTAMKLSKLFWVVGCNGVWLDINVSEKYALSFFRVFTALQPRKININKCLKC